MSNMELWLKVEKTDPRHTKKANVGGNRITAISPQYQIMSATEQFGPYGKGWGFKTVNYDYSLADKFNVVVFIGLFFYPGGEFEISNSIKLFKDNAKTMIDDDFAKKCETDALTKALSKLGFNADVFMGRFDDNRYVTQLNQEIAQNEAQPQPQQTKTPAIGRHELIARMKNKVQSDGKSVEDFIIWIGRTLKRGVSGFDDVSDQELEQFGHRMGLV